MLLPVFVHPINTSVPLCTADSPILTLSHSYQLPFRLPAIALNFLVPFVIPDLDCILSGCEAPRRGGASHLYFEYVAPA